MSQEIDSLSALWAEVHADLKETLKAAVKPVKGPPVACGSALYTLPEYWRPTVGIALIHEETNTLLGNYQEYFHTREKGCRRLVRTDAPIQILRTERVSGAAWVHLEREIMQQTPETLVREVLLPELVLASLGVSAPLVTLRVMFQWGGIIRVELAEHTTFHSPDNRTIVTLARGVNIYECCDLPAKLAIKEELK